MGPVLFTLYVNDLFRVRKHCEPLGFVDDTKLFPFFPASELNDVISAALALTKQSSVGVAQLMRTFFTPLPSAKMLETHIKPVTVAKDLGVYIDCHLNFNEHITKTASDCMFKLTRVNRIKHLLDKKKH